MKKLLLTQGGSQEDKRKKPYNADRKITMMKDVRDCGVCEPIPVAGLYFELTVY